MVRTISKIAVAALSLLALAVFTPQAKAGSVDFSCGGGNPCTGTLTVGSGLAVSSAGVGSLSSSFDGTETFTAVFSTNTAGTGTITISDTDGDSATGSITSTILAPNIAVFQVLWTTLSSGVQAALGQSQGAGASSVITIGTGLTNNVISADFSIVTPEPASLLLMGTGLLGLGGAIRRRWLS